MKNENIRALVHKNLVWTHKSRKQYNGMLFELARDLLVKNKNEIIKIAT